MKGRVAPFGVAGEDVVPATAEQKRRRPQVRLGGACAERLSREHTSHPPSSKSPRGSSSVRSPLW